MNTADIKKVKPLNERDNYDLLELVQQLHTRTALHPHSKEMHDDAS